MLRVPRFQTSMTLLLLGGLWLSTGCGSGRPATCRVSGKATFGGGAWPKAGTIYFTPTEVGEGGIKRPGTGAFDINGNYLASSWDKGDGLLPGKYNVSVECWLAPPSMDGPPARSCVPQRFGNASTSGITLTVAPGERSKTFDFDVPRDR
jgi:hypothetical protein